MLVDCRGLKCQLVAMILTGGFEEASEIFCRKKTCRTGTCHS